MGNCQNVCHSDPHKTSNPTKSKSKYSIQIKTFTWPRESHGLFDYECKSLVKDNLKVTQSGKIVRNKDNIKIIKEKVINDKDNQTKTLVELNCKEGDYYVTTDYTNDIKDKQKADMEGVGEDCPWAVVKTLKQPNGTRGYQLKEGDYIKLGRMRFRLKELRYGLSHKEKPSEKDSAMLKEDENNKAGEQTELDSAKLSLSQSNVCRICLSEVEPDNPLISPCRCAGTMMHIHVKCLQKWLKSRVHMKNTVNAQSYLWKTMECELCKTPFPPVIEAGGQRYDSLEITRPTSNYIMMEILSRDKNIIKGIHVLNLDKKNTIRLGRGHDSDIRITDISVSRCHALIKLEKNGFFIEDNNSKFGTLILMKDPFCLNDLANNVSLQIGRSVLSFQVKKLSPIAGSCFGPVGMKEDKMASSAHREEEKIDNHEEAEEDNIINPPNLDNERIEGDDLIFFNDNPDDNDSVGEENLEQEMPAQINSNPVVQGGIPNGPGGGLVALPSGMVALQARIENSHPSSSSGMNNRVYRNSGNAGNAPNPINPNPNN